MREGVLYRSFQAEFEGGEVIQVSTERFLSMGRKELGCINYSIKLLKGRGRCIVDFYLDGDIRNQDSNYDEKFWEPPLYEVDETFGEINTATKKTRFAVSTGMITQVQLNKESTEIIPSSAFLNNKLSLSYKIDLEQSDTLSLVKIASIVTSRDHSVDVLPKLAKELCMTAGSIGYEELKNEQIRAWDKK